MIRDAFQDRTAAHPCSLDTTILHGYRYESSYMDLLAPRLRDIMSKHNITQRAPKLLLSYISADGGSLRTSTDAVQHHDTKATWGGKGLFGLQVHIVVYH